MNVRCAWSLSLSLSFGDAFLVWGIPIGGREEMKSTRSEWENTVRIKFDSFTHARQPAEPVTVLGNLARELALDAFWGSRVLFYFTHTRTQMGRKWR